jgi:hypothetical protein
VLKTRVKFLLFKALHVIIFTPLAEYSRVLTLPYDVVQLRKTWSCIMMMVPMLKLHASLVEVLVLSIVNGTSVGADFLAVFVILLFRHTDS